MLIDYYQPTPFQLLLFVTVDLHYVVDDIKIVDRCLLRDPVLLDVIVVVHSVAPS